MFVHSTLMLRFRRREVTKETFYADKKLIIMWDVNVENIVTSKLVKAKPNSKYLIGIKLDKATDH